MEGTEEKSKWLAKNFETLCSLEIPFEDWERIIPKRYFDEIYNSSTKDRARYLASKFSIKKLEQLIEDYTFKEE